MPPGIPPNDDGWHLEVQRRNNISRGHSRGEGWPAAGHALVVTVALTSGCSSLLRPSPPSQPALVEVQILSGGSEGAALPSVEACIEYHLRHDDEYIGRFRSCAVTGADGVARLQVPDSSATGKGIRFWNRAELYPLLMKNEPACFEGGPTSVQSLDGPGSSPSPGGTVYGTKLAPGSKLSLTHRESMKIDGLYSLPGSLGLSSRFASDAAAASHLEPAEKLAGYGPDALKWIDEAQKRLRGSGCTRFLPETDAALGRLRGEVAAQIEANQEREGRERARILAEDERRREQPAREAAMADTAGCKIATLKVKACGEQHRINTLQWQIDYEREVGARSGFANTATLHDAASALIAYEQRRDAVLTQLRSEYGTTFDPAMCGPRPRTIEEVRNVRTAEAILAGERDACGAGNVGGQVRDMLWNKIW